MSTPSSSKSKSCAVSGCTEPRLHRNYCAKHQNASLGKSDPLRVNDLDSCVNWILEAINKGVDALHKNSKSDANAANASSTSSIPIEGSNSQKSGQTASTVNEYLQLLQPYTQQMLDNIRNPNAPQPLPASSLDIFSFSTLSSSSSTLLSSPSASTTTLANKGSTPPRPNSQADNDTPPSPDAVLSPSTLVGPIVDIKVQYTKQKKKTPAKYEMLEKSVSGKYEADVNKSGNGKPVTLCYQRGEEIVLVENTLTTIGAAAGTDSIAESETSTNSESENGSNKKKEALPSPTSSNHPSGDVLKPITSLSLIFRDACEEPPYGFSAIDRNTTGGDANLNYHENSRGRQVYLCVHRGEGAPIYDIGLIHHDKRETLPVGFHELKHTPFGNRADLNAAMSSSSEQPPSSQAVYLCFRPHVTPVLRTYLPLLQDAFGSDSVSKGHLLYAKVLALLTAVLYSYDQKMVLHALEGFMRIPPDSIPPALLNRFLQCVCDAAPCFQTYFTTQAHTALLKFLFHSFKTFYQVLSIETFAKILEVCFLTRHEDKQNEISEGMIALLIAKIEKCKPCVCSVAEKKDAQHIGMNAVAGGEGHSKPAAHNKTGDKSATGTTQTDGTTTKEGATPAVSSVLCSDCQWKRAVSNSPLPAFAREIILQLATRVCTAKELESEAKGFQRHTSSSPEFRADIAKLTAQLQSIDKEYFSHINKMTDPASGAPSAAQSTSSSSRPNSSGAARPTPLNVEPDASNGSAAPAPTSAAASASAVAFDELHGGRAKVAEKDRLFYPLKEERFLSVATLICAKFAGEPVSFGLVKSEQMKRKLHALRLLFYILHHGVYFFRSTPGGILLVRRFVCPALMNVCVTDNNLLWRLLLQTFTVLYDQYRSHLMIELGVFFDHILLSLLESTNVTFELKKDVLDMWHHILGKTPQNLVNLFYNYDNHSKNWTIFERLNTVLARISEGEQKSFVPIHVEKSSSSAQSNPQSGQAGTPAPPTTKDQAAELAEQQEEALQRQALKLLVHNLHMLAQWVGVPGLKRSPDIPSKPVITEEDDVNDDGLPRSSASPAPDGTTSDAPTSVTTSALSKHRASRIDTWSFRHDKQKADQKILQEALKLARTEKLKSALQYLRIVDPAYAQPKQIAHFLYTNEGLDKAEVGDFLGSCGDKFMGDDEYESLRAAYLEHLDFTGLLFDQGLRLFLCDSGFRLPGEAQKIDRLLEAFCVAFCRDNPNVFRNHSSAFIVSFALVMLNTDLHDSRLRSGASRRQPMTEEQFIGNLRGVDDKRDFPRSFLETLYRNIAAQAIEWKEKKPDASAVAEEKAKAENQTDIEKQEDQAKAVRKTFEITVRRALAYLKNQAPYFQGYNRTSNTMIAAGMFEVVWYRIISVITLRSDNCTPGDVELLHICLEGLAYGSSIAICLGLPTERQAFSRQLAKISFIERNRDSIKASNMHLRIVQGEHLKQDWYRPFNLLCEKSPARACHVVFDCAHDIKQKINYERRQAKLRQIESDFNHEIVLVDPARSFVREGQLIKLSNSSQQKKQVYVFFLFNDLILYASEGMNSKWKCHRVIHLSLCRLEDLRGIAHAEAHAFRIVSPQKSFVVSAPTKEKKQQWLEAIYHHLKLVMAKRKKYLDEAKKGTGDVSANAHVASAPASSSPTSEDANGKEELLRRYSTFIGQSDMDLNGKFGRQDSTVGGSVGSGLGGGFGSGNSLPTQSSARDLANSSASRTANHCKLCIRPWAIFRRKQKCRFCGDSVCNDCCGQKCMIPGGEKRLVNVCDACYGALKGMVNAEQPLLTVCDA